MDRAVPVPDRAPDRLVLMSRAGVPVIGLDRAPL